jgi:hypothetical protein
MMGAIPIYWGAPNVNDFLPHPDAIIRVSDFGSTKELADYLQLLTTSDTAYQKHMQWRHEPLTQSFLDLFETSPGHPPCHLCDLIAREKIHGERQKKIDLRNFPKTSKQISKGTTDPYPMS